MFLQRRFEVAQRGPDHHKRFLVEVRLKTAEGEPGKQLARGMGSTKKNAEQDAAWRALERMKAAARKAGAEAAIEPPAEEEKRIEP